MDEIILQQLNAMSAQTIQELNFCELSLQELDFYDIEKDMYVFNKNVVNGLIDNDACRKQIQYSKKLREGRVNTGEVITGITANVQHFEDLIVLDFDKVGDNSLADLMSAVKKILKENSKQGKFSIEYPFYAEKTVSGGLHVYLYNDTFTTSNCRRIDVKKEFPEIFNTFNLDMFYYHKDSTKINPCTISGSEIISSGIRGQVLPLIQGMSFYNGLYMTVSLFLQKLGITIQQTKDYTQETETELPEEAVSSLQEFIKEIMLKNKQVVSTNQWRWIVTHVTKMSNIYLDEDEINELLKPIFRKDKPQDPKGTQLLVSKVLENTQVDRASSYNILRQYLSKAGQAKYQNVLVLEQVILNPLFTIDTTEEFSFMDINTDTQTKQELVNQMRKCIAYIVNDSQYIIKKMQYNQVQLSVLTERSFRDYLQPIKTNFFDKTNKPLSMYGIYLEYSQFFQYKQRVFYEKAIGPAAVQSQKLNTFNYHLKQSETKTDLIQHYLKHIKNIICSGNETYFKYMQQWIAYVVQNPGKKNLSAIVLMGKQGTGKNLFTDQLCNLFGSQFSIQNTSGLKNITGQFNSSLINKILVVINEASNAENKHDSMDQLKQLITEDTIEINQKNVPQYHTQNVSNFFICSNNMLPVYLDQSDRRYFVLEVNDAKRGNQQYFQQIVDDTRQGNFLHQLFNYYMTYDISGFKSQNIPLTQEKQDLQELTKSSAERFIQQYIQDNKDSLIKGVTRGKLMNEYENYCKDEGQKSMQRPFADRVFKAYLQRKNPQKVDDSYVLEQPQPQ